MAANQSLDQIVKVKGYKDGLLFIIQPEPTLAEVEEALTKQLSTLSVSLSGIGITLDIGKRRIEEEHLRNLQQWLKQKYGMEIKRIIIDYPSATYPPKNPWKILTNRVFVKAEESVEKMVEPPDQKARIIRQTLRSGQRKEFWEGNLVVLGDVNPGAEVIASKDIIVLGALRGVAHAGALGDISAVIIALNLIPTQLRIGHLVSRPPGERNRNERIIEIARVDGEMIIVEEYKKFY
ncbi:MAG: septum site-determining protein MinC [Candidatus Poribacteria bacterium]